MRFSLIALSSVLVLVQTAKVSSQVSPATPNGRPSSNVVVASPIPLPVKWDTPQLVHLPQSDLEDAISHYHGKPIACVGCPDLNTGTPGTITVYVESEDLTSVRLRYQRPDGAKLGQIDIPLANIHYVVIRNHEHGPSELLLYL